MGVGSKTEKGFRSLTAALLGVTALGFAGCKQKGGEAQPDTPQLNEKVTMQDVTFQSTALQRDIPYRVVMLANIPPGKKLKTAYLLHGGGGGFRDWTNYSDVAKYAEHGLILVMPEGDSSYYANAVERPLDRYEDYIVNDVIADVERRRQGQRRTLRLHRHDAGAELKPFRRRVVGESVTVVAGPEFLSPLKIDLGEEMR